MLTELEVFRSGVTTPPFGVYNQAAEKDYIQILEITGLEPTKVSNGSEDTNRNIVITVGLNPDWNRFTVETLRQKLYEYFMPKAELDMIFKSTERDPVKISGYVEGIEAPIFTKDPEYQISIICEDGYFTAVDPIVVKGVTSAFTAPTTVTIDNAGDVDCGFLLEIDYPTGLSFSFVETDIRVTNQTDKFQMLIATKIPVEYDGRKLVISTVDTNRYAKYVYAENDSESYTNHVQRNSAWVQLEDQKNVLSIMTALAGARWVLTYYPRFGGL